MRKDLADAELLARGDADSFVDGAFYVMTLPPDLELDGVARWIGEDGRTGDEVRFRLP
jgi:hypothetical protein